MISLHAGDSGDALAMDLVFNGLISEVKSCVNLLVSLLTLCLF